MYALSKRLNLTLALTLLIGLFTLWAGLPEARAENSRYFSETGHTVSSKFLDYWNTHGGLAIFGYPITDAQNEVDPETGKTFLTQWFERNRFELHPENAGTKYEVLLGLLGKDINRENLGLGYPFILEQPAAGATFFKETQHNVTGNFLTYWQQNGGLERFGYPISAADQQVDPETGKTFLTQWFERARFEYHPENKGSQYEVLLGLLGKQAHNIRQAFVLEFEHKGARGVVTDAQNNIYVTDNENDKIFKFDSKGTYLTAWGSSGMGDGQFSVLRGIVVDKSGNVYVADDNRVQKFDSNGRFLAKFGSPGRADGQFFQSDTLALDNQGNVYVLDPGNYRIVKFDNHGKFLLTWGGTGSARDKFTSGHGSGHGAYTGPADIAIDSHNNVYVTDAAGSVKKFDSNGGFITDWNLDGYPQGLAVDQQGLVYVTTTSMTRSFLTAYQGDGTVVKQYPSYIFQESLGDSIYVDPQGFVYIAAMAYGVSKYKLS